MHADGLGFPIEVGQSCEMGLGLGFGLGGNCDRVNGRDRVDIEIECNWDRVKLGLGRGSVGWSGDEDGWGR